MSHPDIKDKMVGVGRMPVKDLKGLVKVLRKGRARNYLIGGAKKADLIKMINELADKSLSKKVYNQALNYLHEHSRQFQKGLKNNTL